MRTTRHLRTSSLLVGVLACAGCSSLFTEQPLPVGSPLRAAESSADGVRFEVYWATLPASIEADEQAALWRYVQQERLDESLRGRLARNGLRAGVVGGVPPREVLGCSIHVATRPTPRPKRAPVSSRRPPASSDRR